MPVINAATLELVKNYSELVEKGNLIEVIPRLYTELDTDFDGDLVELGQAFQQRIKIPLPLARTSPHPSFHGFDITFGLRAFLLLNVDKLFAEILHVEFSAVQNDRLRAKHPGEIQRLLRMHHRIVPLLRVWRRKRIGIGTRPER